MMDFEEEAEMEPNSTPKLPLLSMPRPPQSPDHSGMLTPPLYASASVPFRWEEEPGKPRPCTSLIPFSSAITEPKCLDLPPRLLLEPSSNSKITKTTSPTTVLEGPYNGRSKFTSSSFRFFRESFDSTASTTPEKAGQLSTVLLGKKLNKGRGLFGSWRGRNGKIGSGRKETGGSSSFVHPSSSMESASFLSEENSSKRVKITKIRRNGSFSSLSQAWTHFWQQCMKDLNK
ncbi:hypothetical protein M9H77_33103 [Catharanthus roseus]|uniref:Uncharacterized protein n=1 Tax=Catharanthus roseus TaxID=4058 RepID=A0ACB9ZIB6_CATRO|nr:hypothetical protein M9H77_33103 [Catharanthus roseus]